MIVIFMTDALVEGAKRKYAPSYCLRLKFNCASAAKKKHVCCLYPLPIESKGLLATSPNVSPDVAEGVKKIRPLRLPSRATQSVDDGSIDTSNGERYDVFNQKKKSNKPEKKKAFSPKPTALPNPVTKMGKRPRVCLRLVINCRTNSRHRCCRTEPVSNALNQETSSTEPVVEEANAEDDDQETTTSKPKIVGTVEEVPLQRNTQTPNEPDTPTTAKILGSIINEEIPGVAKVTEEPYERIPSECFTMSFDCKANPEHMCCTYQQ